MSATMIYDCNWMAIQNYGEVYNVILYSLMVSSKDFHLNSYLEQWHKPNYLFQNILYELTWLHQGRRHLQKNYKCIDLQVIQVIQQPKVIYFWYIWRGCVPRWSKKDLEIDILVRVTVPNMNSNDSLWKKPSMSTKSQYQLHRNSVFIALPSICSRKSS